MFIKWHKDTMAEVKAIKNRVVILPLWHKDVNLSTTAANIEY